MNVGKRKHIFELDGNKYEVVGKEDNTGCFRGCDMIAFCRKYSHLRRICIKTTGRRENFRKCGKDKNGKEKAND